MANKLIFYYPNVHCHNHICRTSLDSCEEHGERTKLMRSGRLKAASQSLSTMLNQWKAVSFLPIPKIPTSLFSFDNRPVLSRWLDSFVVTNYFYISSQFPSRTFNRNVFTFLRLSSQSDSFVMFSSLFPPSYSTGYQVILEIVYQNFLCFMRFVMPKLQ